MPSRKKSLTFSAQLPTIACVLVLFLGVNTAEAQIRTVLVSPVPGDPVASGTALKSALAGISSPSATNRWLLKIEPGIYDVDTLSLVMRSWVDIEGSGIGVTTIRGRVQETGGTINGANNSELRLLTVEAEGTVVPFNTFRAALLNNSASPRLYRVRFSSVGAGEVFGVYSINNSAPLIEECEINATHLGTGPVVGVEFANFFNSLPTAGRSVILRSKIAVSGGGTNYGVRLRNAQFVSDIRDTRMDVTGGQATYGIFAQQEVNWAWRGHESLRIRNTEISSAGSNSVSYGINFEPLTTIYLDIIDSRVWGHIAPMTFGIRQAGQSAVVLQGSSVVGVTQTVQSAGNASIASTSLNGGPATAQGFIGCVGVWDENGVFFAQGACP